MIRQDTMTTLMGLKDQLVDDRIGIIRRVEEQRRRPGAPDLVYFLAQTCNPAAFTASTYQGPIWGSGVSGDRATAMTKAIGEAVERYSAGTYVAEEFSLSTYDAADFPCVSPDEFALFAPSQYTQTGFPFVPFTRISPIRWMPAYDLCSHQIRYIPAAMAFLPYIPRHGNGENVITPQISTGLACHTEPVVAAIAGICEVIERDAFAITWQARLAWPQVILETLNLSGLDLLRRIIRPGAEIILLHLSMDHGVPVILAAMKCREPSSPALVIAAAAHQDPGRAVEKSLEELGQAVAMAQISKSNEPRFNPGLHWEHVLDPKTHPATYYYHDQSIHAEFLFSSRKRIRFADIKGLTCSDDAANLRTLVNTIKALGHKILLADVTSEDVRCIGLCVLRAVIPGFHPLFMGHRFRSLGGTRLWNVPQKLGYKGISRSHTDNSFPHPFP